MPIRVVATLTPNLSQTIADLQPGDMLLLCLDGPWQAAMGTPGSMLSIGEPYTVVTPPTLTIMDHPNEGTTEYPYHWNSWVMWAAHAAADWSDNYAYVCPWMITGFTGGSHNISINYPDGRLLWGKVIRGVDPAKWGHSYVRAAEIALNTSGQISYNDFPHTVNIDTDDALVLHVFYPQVEFDPTIAPTQPDDYGPQIYALTGDETVAPTLYHLRTIAPAATSFTMSQPNMVLGDYRFFPSSVEVWYIILYGGGEEPPDEDGPKSSLITQVAALIETTDDDGGTGDPEDAQKTRITQVGAYIESPSDGEDTGGEEDGAEATRITQLATYIETTGDGDDTGDEDNDERTRVTQLAAYIGSDDIGGSTGGTGEDGVDATRITQLATYIGSDDTGGSTDGVGEDGAEAIRITQLATYVGSDDTGGSTGGTGEDGVGAMRVTQLATYVGSDDTGGSTGGTGEDGVGAMRVTQLAAYVGSEDGASDGINTTRITQIGAYVGSDDTGGSTNGVGEDGDSATRLTQIGMYIEVIKIEIPPTPGSTDIIDEGEEPTWGRYWQLSAEGQSVADVVRYGTGAYPVISSEKAFTGTHSYRNSAAENVHDNAAFGFALPPASTMRCNLLINHNGVTPSPVTEKTIVNVLKLDCAGVPIAIQWNSADNALELRAGFVPGTSRHRYPIARVTAGTFNQPGAWLSIGLLARLSESGGFVSFYLNQMRLITWCGDTRVYASGSSTPVATITGVYATGSPENSDWYGGWAPWCFIDDFYADAGDGSEADLPAPFIRFYPRFRRPDSADIKAEMIVVGAPTNGQAIGDGVPDGDESYIGASQAAQDIYPLTDVVLDDGWAPTAQIAIGYARKTDAAFDSRVAMEIVTANGVELEGDSAPLGLEYTYVGNRFTADSNNQPLTQQAIDATNLSVTADGEF